MEKRLLNQVHTFNEKDDNEAVFTRAHFRKDKNSCLPFSFRRVEGETILSGAWVRTVKRISCTRERSEPNCWVTPLSWGAPSHSTQKLCDPGSAVPEKRKWACLLAFLCVMGMTLWHHSTEFINDTWMKCSWPVRRTSSQTAKWSLSWCIQLTQSCEKPTPTIASSSHQIICLYSKPIYYLFLSFGRQSLQDFGLWLGEKISSVYTNSSLVDFIKKHFSLPPPAPFK